MHTAHTYRMHVRTCRYNLMEHVGAVSTLRDEPHPESLPRCNDFLGVSALFKSVCLSYRRQARSARSACSGLPFGSEGRAQAPKRAEAARPKAAQFTTVLPLGVPALFLEECYHLGHCPEDDLWPCDFPNASLAPSLPRLVSNWGALCGFHQMLI